MCKEKFNEMEFIKREYELLRFLTEVEGEFSEEAKQKMEIIREEFLNNEESLRYAINVTEDIFGIKHFNAPITASFILLDLENIKTDVAEELINNLLFEYQAEDIPLILTGKVIFGTPYLTYLLLNNNYKIDEKYNERIGECIIQSTEKEFDTMLLTLYFRRTDISNKHKKLVIDSLDNDVLYRLINEWQESFMNTMVSNLNLNCLDLTDEEEEEFEKEFENLQEETVSSFADVIKLINEKLYF